MVLLQEGIELYQIVCRSMARNLRRMLKSLEVRTFPYLSELFGA